MTTNVKEFAVVKAIMAILKLDDAGKLGKFFNQEVKSSREAIAGLELNIQVKNLERKQQVNKSDKAIEDASDEVEGAYQSVKPENIDTNAKMTAFSYDYWEGVKRAEKRLGHLQEQAKVAKEVFEKELEEIALQIKKYKARIDRITK